MIGLEIAHKCIAKIVQGAPLTPLATLGWMSLISFVALIKIMFMFRTLPMIGTHVYKDLILIQLIKLFTKGSIKSKFKSPVSCVFEYATNYGWFLMDFGTVESWKRIVEDLIEK